MSVETKYVCPECGSIDLDVKKRELRDANDKSLSTARCPNCCWEGRLEDSVGVATTERLWTTERVAELMLRLMARHAAGPMIQAYEFIGLLQRIKYVPDDETSADQLVKHNALAQFARDHVMQEVFAASIEAGFAAAEASNRAYALEMNRPLHPMLRHDIETPDQSREFGGDVIPMDRKK